MKHKENILRLRAEGKSYNQIADELGCSKGTVSYHIGFGQKEKTKNIQGRNREAINDYIRSVKESAPCADCENYYGYWIMDFDHVKEKSFEISNYKNHTGSFQRVKEEIAKCDVVCANCHRDRTYSRLFK
jgi:predicted transcriptional regulator